jgi:hypothetical protein
VRRRPGGSSFPPRGPAARSGDDDDDDPPPQPPPHDNEASLVEFALGDPYFYRYEGEACSHGTLRRSALYGRTVEPIFKQYLDVHGVGGIERLGRAIRARPGRIQAFYCARIDDETRQELATPTLEYLCQCEFRTAVISAGTIAESLRPLMPPVPRQQQGKQQIGDGGGEGDDSGADVKVDDRTVDLSFLDPLRVKGNERFLAARQIYVRDSMREVFGRFREDALRGPRPPPDKARSAALAGFPGVGTSTLFFLAAIDQARTSNVVYYRRVEAEPISMFVMTPHYGSLDSSKDGTVGGVRVWYTRDVCGVSLGIEGLTALHRALIKTGVVDRGTYYAFVDGPQPKDATNLLHSQYDYYCVATYDYSKLYDENGQLNKRLWKMDLCSASEAGKFLDWLANHGSRRSPLARDVVKDGGGDSTTKHVESKKTDEHRRYGGSLREMLAAHEREQLSIDGGGSG